MVSDNFNWYMTWIRIIKNTVFNYRWVYIIDTHLYSLTFFPLNNNNNNNKLYLRVKWDSSFPLSKDT